MTTIYKCIKSFIDGGGDRARIGQEFVIRKDSTEYGTTVLDRKSGRGSYIVIPVEKLNTYFQEVKPVTKNELGTPKKEFTTLHKKELKEKKELQNEFKVGDKVMIAKSSEYYGVSESNPAGIEGTVTLSRETDFMGFSYEVKWSNGRQNSYKEGDLVASEEKELPRTKKEFKVGDRVKILVPSIYPNSNSNPIGIEGTVIDTGRLNKVAGASLDLEVRWDNNKYNMYNPGDLVLATGTKPAKLPIGAKVEVLVNQPNSANMKKGQIGVIKDLYRDVPGYTSYKISDGKGNTWAIRQEHLEVVEEKKPDYCRFTRGFNDTLQVSGLPLRVGMGTVATEDQFECLVVLGNEYTPILEKKNGRMLIKLIKTQNLPF